MKRLAAILGPVLLAGCASIPWVSNQHPSFAMNSADCSVMGAAITSLATASPISIVAGTAISKAFCDAESSLAAGQPAQITTVTQTTSATTKMP